MASMKSRSKGVSQVLSSLMIMFLLLTALATYTIFLSKSYDLASKTIVRAQREAYRSMEEIVVKPIYNDNETVYVLDYEGLKPKLKYVVIKCGNETIFGKPEDYGLKLGEPIPYQLMDKIRKGCKLVVVSERGKVYDISSQIEPILTIGEEIQALKNITNINLALSNITNVVPFIGNISLNVEPGRIYVFGADGSVLYDADILGNIPIYDIITNKLYGAPLGKYLGVFSGNPATIPSEHVLSIGVTMNRTTIFKLPIYGTTPDGEIVLNEGVYLIYLAGEAYEGYEYYGIKGEGAKVIVDIYYDRSRIAYKVLNGADRTEYYYRGLELNEWSGQFDGIFALIVLEGQVTIEYYVFTESSTTYTHHTFVVEKIADIGGNDKLKIVKHNDALFLEFENHMFSLAITDGVVSGSLYELGSYIITPIGYVINGSVSRGEPVSVSSGTINVVFFKPLIFRPFLNPMLLGIEKRHIIVRDEATYAYYRQTSGDFLDQSSGLSLRIYYVNTKAVGNILTYTIANAIIPSNYYITVNILSAQSKSGGTWFTIIYAGNEVFRIDLPTSYPKSYLVKIGGNSISLGQLTIKLETDYLYPDESIKISMNF